MSSKPNILWLMTDQHSPHIAGFSGDSKARTENLDALAEQSVRFDSAYCQAPLCVPSRMSMLTGKYACRIAAWANSSILYPHERLLPELLGDAGYTTALVGKMHLRGPRWMGGFEHRPYGDLVVDRFCFHQPDPVDTWDGRWSNHSVGRFHFAGETQIPESLLVDGVVTREALSFLLEHASNSPGKPWLMCASYSRPHFPLTTPGRYFRRACEEINSMPPRLDGFPDSLHPHDRFVVEDFRLAEFSDEQLLRGLRGYYACVDYVDDCIGGLLDGLREAGLLDNTCIIYTSDHGDMAAELGLWCKRTFYDASAGVPLLISLPGGQPRTSVDVPVELVDLLPTMCELAGTRAPEGIDGESLLPLLEGRSSDRCKRAARSELLAPRREVQFRMARDERWKYVEFPETQPVLFDLESDPCETTNLYGTPSADAAPLHELREVAAAGLTWEGIDRMRNEEMRTRPNVIVEGPHGPAQYMLKDGRIVEADIFLYPGLLDGG